MLSQQINKSPKSNILTNSNKQIRINEGICATYYKTNVKNIPIEKKKSVINKSNNDYQYINKIKINSEYSTNPKTKMNFNENKNKIIKNIEFKTFSNILNKNINKSNEKELKNSINNAIDNLILNSNKQM